MSEPLTKAEIEAGLRRLKPAVADRFLEVSDTLESSLDSQQLQQWQSICWQLADAGWHGWETANDFIHLAEILDTDRLLSAGSYSLGFVKSSFEPGRTYLRGIAQISDDTLRAQIEAAGEVLLSRFQQASNLHNHYFNAAFTVAESCDPESLLAWCQIAEKSCDLERPSLLKFLQLSERVPDQHWSALIVVSEGLYSNLLELLSFSSDVQRALAPVETEFLELAGRFAEVSLEDCLAALAKTLPLLGESRSRTLMGLLDSLHTIEQCTALVNEAEHLPLDQEWLVTEWLSRRPETDNEQATIAYLQLASAQSESQLQSLMGKVRLHEEQRSLQLFAEGLCGTRLRIEAGESLPSSDGLVIYLPSEIAFYKTRLENYRWLKIALMHQLGCYEFGTFDLNAEGSLAIFSKQFNQYEQPMLAEQIFTICEAARIDWRVAAEYPGVAQHLRKEKASEVLRRESLDLSRRAQLLESLIAASLDETRRSGEFEQLLKPLRETNSTVQDSLLVMASCYELISKSDIDLAPRALVAYRGHIALDDASLNLQLTALEELQAELSEEFADEEDGMEMHGSSDSSDIDVDELEAGEVDNPSAVMPADDEISPDGFDQMEDPVNLKRLQQLLERRQAVEQTFRYDEWDYTIQDYRRRFCTLFEFRQLEQDFDFVPNTLAEHRALANRVRRQLNMLRPELLRKVKGVSDGEELDLERAIEAMVDKKSGVSPSEHIYVQRQRKERDVAALFLLDMSASTDDLIEPEPPVYVDHEDDYLHGFSFETDEPAKERGKTILELEKESVVLMAEALEGLGDSYAVCGFSGYGKDRIEYYVCKDFDQPYNYHAKANIGGIKPCRSTRMGPAIRHATKMLAETESRIKALIIISDGYPQDFDYGQDRNSKDYGIKDTTKALSEASQKGVQSFCLTVDPGGHDYLREMCPDQQYMVMQDITQLPDELSKVYRGLTS